MDQAPHMPLTTSESIQSMGNRAPPSSVSPPEGVVTLDIEHTLVEDDPRIWSNARKNSILLIVLGAAVISGLCMSIQNPANSQIEEELHATAPQISLTLSLYIIIQGNFPIIWSAVSEIMGRKVVYLVSLVLFMVGSANVAMAKTIGVVIGMRVLQAVGGSSVLAVGAATLADIYEPHQRGTIMGIFYVAPLLGPSVGSLLGGGLTQGFSWRAIFWFLVIWGGVIFLACLFLLKDTFRKERSLTYQNAARKRTRRQNIGEEQDSTRARPASGKTLEEGTCGAAGPEGDLEAQPVTVPEPGIQGVRLSIADINPIPPYLWILSRKNNVFILSSSGLIFAFTYSIAYTCARTLSLHYNYDAMTTGLVLLSFGIGSILGSIAGGRLSDRMLAKYKAENGGIGYPEMRLESTKIIMWMLPLAVVGYAWVCQQHVHIAAICVMLFLSGFCSIWIYASALAYIVDANVGRSSIAVATNSSFRGLCGFIAAEIAIPLQDTIGEGGLYTLWAGLMLLAQLMVLLVLYKGKQWREASIEAEERKSKL